MQATPTSSNSTATEEGSQSAIIYHSSSYETTPLLSFAAGKEEETVPIGLNSSGRYNNTSNKYTNTSGKYVQVPRYPSNRNYNSGSSIYKVAGLPSVLLTVVFQSIGFTLVLPSMYLYLKSLDGSDSFYGWVVAMYRIYSVGSFLGSILFGWWSDARAAKETVAVAAIISVLGNALYCTVIVFPIKYGPWLMLVARFLVGFGSGCVAVCRAYCSEAVDFKSKVKVMASVSAAQGIGFVIGPGLGSFSSIVNFKVFMLEVNSNTAPGYLSALLCLISFFVVVFFMPATSIRRDSKKTNQGEKESQAAVYASLCLFFAAVSVFAIFETDFTVLSKRDFQWGSWKNSIYFLVAALISTAMYFVIGGIPKFKKADERIGTAIGYSLLILGMLSFIVYDKPWHLERTLNLTQVAVGGGCQDKQIGEEILTIFTVFFSIGYPIASTYIFGLYSKILNPIAQGSKMGWITAAGSLARMLGPIWASNALHDLGDTVVFGGTAIFLVLALLLLFGCYKILIPHKDYGKAPPSEA